MIVQKPNRLWLLGAAIALRSCCSYIPSQLYLLKSYTHHTSCFFINLLKSIKFALKLRFWHFSYQKLAMTSGGCTLQIPCFRDPLLGLYPLIPQKILDACCYKCVIYLLLCWPYANNIYLLSRTNYAGIIGGSLLTVNTYIYSFVRVCMLMFSSVCIIISQKWPCRRTWHIFNFAWPNGITNIYS